MKKLIQILGMLLIVVSMANAQNQPNLPSIDRETYALWQKGDWKNLIKVGKQALKSDIDFYYLRVRMGIAYYETKNYHAAIDHFEKAYKTNQQEAYLNEYLYFSYLYSGRFMESQILLSSFSPALQKKVGKQKDNFINGVSLYYSMRNMEDNSVIYDFATSYIAPNDGLQEITKSLNVLNIGLRHDFNPKFSLNHSFSNIQKESFEYRVNNGTVAIDENLKTSINQYYIAGNSRIVKGLNLLYGFHVIRIRYPEEVSYFRQGNLFTSTQTAKETDLVGFLSLYKDLKYITVGSSASFAGLNAANQLQGDVSLTLYPLGNLNLYAASTGTFQRELYSNKTYNDALVFNQLIGFKTTRFLWLEGFLTLGNLNNFVANNGATVYNGTETIKQRMGGRIIVLLNPNVNFQINYTYSKSDSYFIESLDASAKHNPVEYNNHSITGGIIWNL